MKRIWIGIGLLLGLLVAGILVAEVMEDVHMTASGQLEQAARLALAEDWTGAESLTRDARRSWEKKWCFTASFADHEPMDEIDAQFAELEVYAADREAMEYSAAAARLAQLLKSMGHSHTFSWWNLM
ncbi:MAG: DUF4363 family protein [Oscillospiraceae bacterium]|nr:DUF4363 family protein [Oscillospiraceae bacterium]